MSGLPTEPQRAYDGEALARGLMTDGIIACTGAFSREWAEQMRQDMEAAFADAIRRPGGAVGRGPNRYYVEIPPEQLAHRAAGAGAGGRRARGRT